MCKEDCGRCHKSVKDKLVMSFFNTLMLCKNCLNTELILKRKIVNQEGRGALVKYNGCGYIPHHIK